MFDFVKKMNFFGMCLGITKSNVLDLKGVETFWVEGLGQPMSHTSDIEGEILLIKGLFVPC